MVPQLGVGPHVPISCSRWNHVFLPNLLYSVSDSFGSSGNITTLQGGWPRQKQCKEKKKKNPKTNIWVEWNHSWVVAIKVSRFKALSDDVAIGPRLC